MNKSVFGITNKKNHVQTHGCRTSDYDTTIALAARPNNLKIIFNGFRNTQLLPFVANYFLPIKHEALEACSIGGQELLLIYGEHLSLMIRKCN